MSNSPTPIIKVQVPMSKDLRDRFAARAEQLGFDSAQAFFRFLAKAEVDGRRVNFSADTTWDRPPQVVQDRWDRQITEHEKQKKAGNTHTYTDVDDFMRDLTV